MTISKNFRKPGLLTGFLIVGLMILLSTQCLAESKPHIRHHIEKVSRDYTYIDFLENKKPFEIISTVGGEHMTFYKVLAFEKDEFCVTLTTLDGVVFFGISGKGVHIESLPTSNAKKKVVKVEALETIFTIDLSAHPYGEYQLQIEKLHPASKQRS